MFILFISVSCPVTTQKQMKKCYICLSSHFLLQYFLYYQRQFHISVFSSVIANPNYNKLNTSSIGQPVWWAESIEYDMAYILN